MTVTLGVESVNTYLAMPQFTIENTLSLTDPFALAYLTAMFFTNAADGGDVADAAEIADRLNNGDGDSGGFYRVTVRRDYGFSDVAPTTLAVVLAECAAFRRCAGSLVEGRESEAGHDFWMTREGHGCGFWDGDWDDAETDAPSMGRGTTAERLTTLAKAFGETYPYVGDDGLIYCMGAETWQGVADRMAAASAHGVAL